MSVDQQYLRSEDRVQAFQAYKVHQLTSANGTIIREYVSPKGLVFGVTWQGPFMPNMHQLLGSYVTNLQTASPSSDPCPAPQGADRENERFRVRQQRSHAFWKWKRLRAQSYSQQCLRGGGAMTLRNGSKATLGRFLAVVTGLIFLGGCGGGSSSS